MAAVPKFVVCDDASVLESVNGDQYDEAIYYLIENLKHFYDQFVFCYCDEID